MMAALDAIIISIAAVITAVGSLAGSLAMGAKNLAEARATRDAAEHTARQVSPNHGSSLADAVHRIERTVHKLEADADTEHLQIRRRIGRLEDHLFPSSPGGPRQ